MKKYVIVGASSRAFSTFAKAIASKYSEYAELAGVYDINYERAKLFVKEIGKGKAFESFDDMIKDTKPDTVIVTTVDAFHHEYIIKALEAGCDAITEKPMTIDPEKCNAIIEAEKRTGKKVTVTFNYRFIPYVTKIKELIKSDEIGKILSVDFEWLLEATIKITACLQRTLIFMIRCR